MDEHKENIRAKDVNVKMSNPRENEKVSVSSELASCCDRSSILTKLNKHFTAATQLFVMTC